MGKTALSTKCLAAKTAIAELNIEEIPEALQSVVNRLSLAAYYHSNANVSRVKYHRFCSIARRIATEQQQLTELLQECEVEL